MVDVCRRGSSSCTHGLLLGWDDHLIKTFDVRMGVFEPHQNVY